ncbi:radical SAM domain protein [Desulfosarcina variabilis str. Montpellier]
MSHLSIRRLASGGVITNYYCVSRCAHCLYNSSPRRDKAYLDPDLAETIFRQIAAHGCRSVHIGGGESFLDPEGLIRVATAARDAGMGIDYIETNSAWFVDTAQAITLLKELKASGVHTLLVSISPFHNAHIPYAHVKGVIDACRQARPPFAPISFTWTPITTGMPGPTRFWRGCACDCDPIRPSSCRWSTWTSNAILAFTSPRFWSICTNANFRANPSIWWWYRTTSLSNFGRIMATSSTPACL